MKYLPQIADYFGVTVDYLLGSSPEQLQDENLSDTKKELLALLEQADDEKLKQITDYVEFLMKKR